MVRDRDVYAIRGALEFRQELMKRLYRVEASGAELSIWGRYHRSDLDVDQRRELDDFAIRFVRREIAHTDERLHKMGVFMEAPPVYGFNQHGLPIGITYSAEKKCFLDQDGEPMPHGFYEAWERRIHEFPEPAREPTEPDITNRPVLTELSVDELFTRHAKLVQAGGAAKGKLRQASIQREMDAVCDELRDRGEPFAREVGHTKENENG